MRKKITIVAILFGTIFVGFLGVILYINSQFRVASTDPNNDIISSSQQTIKINFNKQLKDNQNLKEKISLSSNSKYEVKQSEKNISIYLEKTVPEGEKIKIELINIESMGGESLSKKINFTSKYVDFKKLSDAEKNNQISNSDSFESEFPIINNLPFSTPDYDIYYKYPNYDEKKIVIVITNLAIPINSPSEDVTSIQYKEVISKSRTAAINWLKNNGLVEGTYILEFPEPVLLNEFNGRLVTS